MKRTCCDVSVFFYEADQGRPIAAADAAFPRVLTRDERDEFRRRVSRAAHHAMADYYLDLFGADGDECRAPGGIIRMDRP